MKSYRGLFLLVTVLVIWSSVSFANAQIQGFNPIDLGFHFRYYSINEDESLLAIAGPQRLVSRTGRRAEQLDCQVIIIDLSKWKIISRVDIEPIDSLLLIGDSLVLKEDRFSPFTPKLKDLKETFEIRVVNATTHETIANQQFPKSLDNKKLKKWLAEPGQFRLGSNLCLRVNDLSTVWHHEPRGTLGLRHIVHDKYSMFDIYPEPNDQCQIAYYQLAEFPFGHFHEADTDCNQAQRKWGLHRPNRLLPKVSFIKKAESLEFPVIVRLAVMSKTYRLDYHHRMDGLRFARQEFGKTSEFHTLEARKKRITKPRKLVLHGSTAYVVIGQRIIRAPFPESCREQQRFPLRIELPGLVEIDLNEVTNVPVNIVGEARQPVLELDRCDVPGVELREQSIVIDGPRLIGSFKTVFDEYFELQRDGRMMNRERRSRCLKLQLAFSEFIDYQNEIDPTLDKYSPTDFTDAYQHTTGRMLTPHKTPFTFSIRLKAGENNIADMKTITFIALVDTEVLVELSRKLNQPFSDNGDRK